MGEPRWNLSWPGSKGASRSTENPSRPAKTVRSAPLGDVAARRLAGSDEAAHVPHESKAPVHQ